VAQVLDQELHDRLVDDRDHRLGQAVGQGTDTGAAAGSQDQGFHHQVLVHVVVMALHPNGD
jgi:hypothetical protein